MGIFSRSNNNTPSNAEMAELGREYAIAKRHGDRKTVTRINRQLGTSGMSDSDHESFEKGRESYDSIPPIPRGRNRRK